MADCMFHGYSGGPGPCSQCQAEDERGLERGKLKGFDSSLARAVIEGPDQHPDPLVRTSRKKK